MKIHPPILTVLTRKSETLQKTAKRTLATSTYMPIWLLFISENSLLNLDGGVVIGNEKLTSFSGAYTERVFVGLSFFQGIMFVPKD